MLGAAESTAAEGNIALTGRRYAQAAHLFGQAAGYVPSGQPDERLGYSMRQAEALLRQGDERGDNDALHISIEICCRGLEEFTRERAPSQWAMTQLNLGTALRVLGERGDDAALIVR